MSRNSEAYKKQEELLMRVIKTSGINIITCCHCGEVNLHETRAIEEEEHPITCHSCDVEIFPNDCPDLFY